MLLFYAIKNNNMSQDTFCFQSKNIKVYMYSKTVKFDQGFR